ncbi:archaea-specific SMC-related protein [Haloarchaeobius iranensis]|uniref:AAA domain-containing protein n=1 Tax=Haloarchaeobius iranensis TaxID=996166 RepID=A0A1G9UW22_9EURY|nr:archaea-specific SMC-related protein [Haloarchaeobius iranensis]SDM64113.1 AAA domain-containing protein [Haloarchaeobius iranensis]
MDSVETADHAVFSVSNVGGIDDATVELERGVTVLSGRNATNRTSFLQSVMAAVGSDDASLKRDADEGRVDLELGDETYTRTLRRTAGGTVTTDGDPFTDDPELAELFAFLLEDNEARRAVATRGDLRELLMRPIDTTAIEQEIADLEREKADLDERLDELDSLKGELPELEAERTRIEDAIDEKRAELAEVEGLIEDADASVEASQREKQALESKLSALSETRSELESVRGDIESQKRSIESLRAERSDVENELAELPETPMGNSADLEREIDRLRTRKNELNAQLSELMSIVEFNEELLDGDTSLPDDVGGDDEDGALTDQLVDDTVTCWTCGTRVEADQVAATVAELRSVRQDRLDDLADVEDEIETLREEQRELERAQSSRESAESRLRRVEDELDRRRDALDDLQARRRELTEDIEALEAEVDEQQTREHGEVLDRHREANQLEFEIDGLEDDLADVEAEIERIESRLDREADLQGERDAVADQLTDLRTRVERIERDAVEAFNEHMETVLGVLDYDNVERVWIERRETDGGRGGDVESTFELHIVRSTASGTTYEDTVDHLSESEREVTGLVFALAGYLVHEVYESVPFMLLDSLEAIDAERLTDLVAHFADYADFLVVALLPEDAAALDDDYRYVTEI